MTEVKRDYQDIFIAPTEQQLNSLGSVFCGLIQSAVIQNRLLGIESEGIWDFEIEGNLALVDQNGFTRDPTLGIAPRDRWTTSDTRSFLIMSGRTNEKEDDHLIDCYRVTLFKNTHLVQGVSKAELGRELAEALENDRKQVREEIIQDRRRPSLGSIIVASLETTHRNADTFYTELETQLAYGGCNQKETLELLELLQRAQPTTLGFEQI